MKILIITERIDKHHESFGFFHGRLLDFARKGHDLTIICLELREHNLPPEIAIRSLGKEKKKSRFAYVRKLLAYAWAERAHYDHVFVHLTPHYVVLAGWLWRLLGKDVVLWYSHPFVDGWLWMAEKFATRILTTSENRFRITSTKVTFAHGLTDLEAYEAYLRDSESRKQ